MSKPLPSPHNIPDDPHRSEPDWATKHDLKHIEKKLDQIMATQAEIVAQLATVKSTLDKVATEETALMDKIAELQAIIAATPDATPELVAAVQAVADQAGVLDALVPDAPPAP
jgi:hypothetical protein